MQMTCNNCGKDCDETVFTQFIDILEKEMGKPYANDYQHSGRCPECYRQYLKEIKDNDYKNYWNLRQ
jgi:hypothetical protein